jgi:hypothetical protein
MKRAGLVLVAVLLSVVAPVLAAPSKYLIQDPVAAQRIDYLIVAGDVFAERLDELANHRSAQGYAVGIVLMSSLRQHFCLLEEFTKHAVAEWKPPHPAYLLLVGNVDAVPTVVRPGALAGWRSDADLATDFDYACCEKNQARLHVGRFPCNTPEELDVIVRKTIDYETKLPVGSWQRRLNLVAGVPGFGEGVDAVLENVTMQMIAAGVPRSFDIQCAYSNPSSPYCPYPPDFNQCVLDMVNGGSLLTLFLGHGTPAAVAALNWNGKRYEVFSGEDASRLRVLQGLPVLALIACSTGRFDAGECLGGICLKTAGGPVACISGSRVTQPYANTLFTETLTRHFFGQEKTLGEILSSAKRDVLAHSQSSLTIQADAAATLMQNGRALEPMRRDVVAHYNLLGDPALVIRRPANDVTLTVRGDTVEIVAPGHKQVELTLECGPLEMARPLPDVGTNPAKLKEEMNLRRTAALEKVLQRRAVELTSGSATVQIALPQAPGRYYLKAVTGGSVGVAMLRIPSSVAH